MKNNLKRTPSILLTLKGRFDESDDKRIAMGDVFNFLCGFKYKSWQGSNQEFHCVVPLGDLHRMYTNIIYFLQLFPMSYIEGLFEGSDAVFEISASGYSLSLWTEWNDTHEVDYLKHFWSACPSTHPILKTAEHDERPMGKIEFTHSDEAIPSDICILRYSNDIAEFTNTDGFDRSFIKLIDNRQLFFPRNIATESEVFFLFYDFHLEDVIDFATIFPALYSNAIHEIKIHLHPERFDFLQAQLPERMNGATELLEKLSIQNFEQIVARYKTIQL